MLLEICCLPAQILRLIYGGLCSAGYARTGQRLRSLREPANSTHTVGALLDNTSPINSLGVLLLAKYLEPLAHIDQHCPTRKERKKKKGSQNTNTTQKHPISTSSWLISTLIQLPLGRCVCMRMHRRFTPPCSGGLSPSAIYIQRGALIRIV